MQALQVLAGHECHDRGEQPRGRDDDRGVDHGVGAAHREGGGDGAAGQTQSHKPGAPQGPPSAQQLHQQASRSKPCSAPGMDGWRPAELKHLPCEAWEQRRRVLLLSYKLGRSPSAYYHVSAPALRKFDKLAEHDVDHNPNNSTSPSELRLLAIFGALYRIESGATFRSMLPWMLTCIHPDLHGCTPGHDNADVSWDAQAQVEELRLNGDSLTILLVDFMKFFDLFDYNFVRHLLIQMRVCVQYADLISDLYTNMVRYIKIRNTYGAPIYGYNGRGPGDPAAILAALFLISVQFYFLDDKHPSIKKGSFVDDRNIRGRITQVIAAYKDIATFDRLAGHYNNPKKPVALATDPLDKKRSPVTQLRHSYGRGAC